MTHTRSIETALALGLVVATVGFLAASCAEVDDAGGLVAVEAIAEQPDVAIDPLAPVERDPAVAIALDPGGHDDDPECLEGEIALCYRGPDGTLGVGECRAGIRTCSDEGDWGRCMDSIEPAEEETCDGVDDDCDGEVDEGCCEVDEACEPERLADFCSDTLVTITCEAGTDCICPAGEWCHLQCPGGGCVFRWETESCATLECDSCDCGAVPPPPDTPAVASACWRHLAP